MRAPHAKASAAANSWFGAPYVKPLTQLVVDYIQAEGIGVSSHDCFEIAGNLEVGTRDPMLLVNDVARLDLTGVDAMVLSACVQMPSLLAIQRLEDRLCLPVVSTAICTVRGMLDRLGLDPVVPGAGALLSGRYPAAALMRRAG